MGFFFNYYRKSIKNFAHLSAPISDLTKGNPRQVSWNSQHDQVLDHLKQKLCTAPILAHPDFSQPFILFIENYNFFVGSLLILLVPICYQWNLEKSQEISL